MEFATVLLLIVFLVVLLLLPCEKLSDRKEGFLPGSFGSVADTLNAAVHGPPARDRMWIGHGDRHAPRREYNEECAQNENAHCMMSDGTEGKCVLDGVCMPSAMNDPQRDITRKPWCTLPTFAKDCDKYCECTSDGRASYQRCLSGCRSTFAIRY